MEVPRTVFHIKLNDDETLEITTPNPIIDQIWKEMDQSIDTVPMLNEPSAAAAEGAESASIDPTSTDMKTEIEMEVDAVSGMECKSETKEKPHKFQLEEYSEVYQFRLTLVGTRPSIWRRIQVPATYNFFDLHIAIQDAFQGWIDVSTHEFKLPDGSFVNYAGREFQSRVVNHNGWDVKIRDYFSLQIKEKSGDKKKPAGTKSLKRKADDSISQYGDTASASISPRENAASSYLSFKNAVANTTPSELDQGRAGTFGLMGATGCWDIFGQETSNAMGNSEWPCLSLVQHDPTLRNKSVSPPSKPPVEQLQPAPVSPEHIFNWKILPLPSEQTTNSQEYQAPVYHDMETVAAAELLLSLSSGSSSSGNSPPLQNVFSQINSTQDSSEVFVQAALQKLKKEKFFPRSGKKCVYTYDMIDKWQISVILENILPRRPDRSYPISIGGKRHGPPEQCGGVMGYYGLLRDIAVPGTEKWIEAMAKLCDTERALVTGLEYNPNGFNFKDVVFQDPRKILLETEMSFPVHPSQRRAEAERSEENYTSN